MWNDKDNLTKDNKRIKDSDPKSFSDAMTLTATMKLKARPETLVGEAKILAFPVRSAKMPSPGARARLSSIACFVICSQSPAEPSQ